MVSEVVWPIDIGPPDVAVLMVTPLEVFVLSKVRVEVEFTSKADPSIVNVPSISVLSRLDVPSTAKSPVTDKLSLTVVSDVVWPIDIGTDVVAVPIVIPLEVFELSMFNVEVESKEILEPSTTSVPSMSVSSKLAVPSTAKLVLTVRLLNVGESDVLRPWGVDKAILAVKSDSDTENSNPWSWVDTKWILSSIPLNAAKVLTALLPLTAEIVKLFPVFRFDAAIWVTWLPFIANTFVDVVTVGTPEAVISFTSIVDPETNTFFQLGILCYVIMLLINIDIFNIPVV